MRCPKCRRMMEKIDDSYYLSRGAYFYKCKHCNYITVLMVDNNKPFGQNYEIPADGNKDLEEWVLKKKYLMMGILEHKKIVKEMQEKYGYGKLKNDDKYNLLIDIYLYNKKIEEKQERKNKRIAKKKKGKKDDKRN